MTQAMEIQRGIEIQQGDVIFRAESWKDIGSLFSKIASVTGDMKTVEKSAHHQQGWNYAPWDKISEAVNESLGKNHLAMITSQVREPDQENLQSKNGGSIVRCNVIIDIVLGDGDTGAMAFARWYGQADDTSGGEKAIDKALTYAAKSFVKKLFVVSTGEDDPEGTDSGADPTTSKRSRTQQPPRQDQQRPQQPPPVVSQQPAPLELVEKPKPTTSEPAAEAENVTSIHTAPAFFAEAQKLGYEKADVKLIFGYFGETSYAADRHVALLTKLQAWHTLREAMKLGLTNPNDELRDDAILKEMVYLGLKKDEADAKITLDDVTTALPMYKAHLAFSAKLSALADGKINIGETLKSAGLLPWRPEKEEFMLRTVEAAIKMLNQPADVVEPETQIQDVAAGVEEVDPFAELALEGAGVGPERIIVHDIDAAFDDLFGVGAIKS